MSFLASKSMLVLAVSALCVPLVAQGSLPTPIGHWDFNEGQGSVLHDRSGSGIDGQITGAQWTTGVVGSGLQFNGFSDFVNVTEGSAHPSAIANLAEGTVSVWFRFDSVTAPGEIHPIFYSGDGIGGPTNSSFILEIGHFAMDAELYFTILDGTGLPIQCFDSGFPLQPGTWYHFAAVVGADYNTGFLNGIEMTSRHYNFGQPSDHSWFQEVPNQQACWFGRGKLGFNPSDQWFHGALDEFRVYDRALDPVEIHQLYLLSTQVYPGTLEDFALGTGIDGAPCTTGGSADIKQILRGHFLTVELSSPGWTFLGAPLVLAGDLVAPGAVVAHPSIPGLWLSVPGFFVLVDGTQQGPYGFRHVVTPGGSFFGFQIPITLPPLALILQAATVSPLAATGTALSQAHEIRIL